LSSSRKKGLTEIPLRGILRSQIINCNEAMDEVAKKLNRVVGQVEGIRKMYQGERECLEVVQQIAAVRQALARIGREMLTGEAMKCWKSSQKRGDFDKVLKQLFRA
jgi:DNA-binding FrmR family transcriptional regulator